MKNNKRIKSYRFDIILTKESFHLKQKPNINEYEHAHKYDTMNALCVHSFVRPFFFFPRLLCMEKIEQ